METDMSKQMASINVQVLQSPPPIVPSQSSRSIFIAQLTLRILVTGLTLAAAVILANSAQTVMIFGIPMHASYTYSSACKYQLVADSLVCASSFLSLIFLYSLTRPKSNPKNFFYLFLHDLAMVVMLISACAAGTANGFIAKYGQNESGWMPICDRVGKFCDRMAVSMALSYVAFCCMLLLTVMAAYTLKSLPN